MSRLEPADPWTEVSKDDLRVLDKWLEINAFRLKHLGWFRAGRTGVPVGLVERHRDSDGRFEHLILKFCSTDAQVSSVQRALHESPKGFVERHLGSLVGDPVRLEPSWAIFQTVAAGHVGNARPLSELVQDGDNGYAVLPIVLRSVLADWNSAGYPTSRTSTAGTFVTGVLGERIAPDGPIRANARRLGLVSGSRDLTIARHDWGTPLPNPLRVVDDHALSELMVPTVFVGKAHGDLNGRNILLPTRPKVQAGRYQLIDLDRYRGDAPLARDPMHLLVALVMDDFGENRPSDRARHDMIRAVVDPHGSEVSPHAQHIQRLSVAVHQGVDRWASERGSGLHWDEQKLLALSAAALMHVGRDLRTPDPDRDRAWCLELAAVALREFEKSVHGNDPYGPQRSSTPVGDQILSETYAVGREVPTRSPSPARPDPRPDDHSTRPRRASGKHVVGRGSEVRRFADVIGGRTRSRVLNIYGPGGIGKTEVFNKFVELGGQHGAALGYGDVAEIRYDDTADRFTAAEVLRAITHTMNRSELAPFRRALQDWDLADGALRAVGGDVGAMYGPTGAPDPDGPVPQITADASSVMKGALRNRFAFDRYLRGARVELTRVFCDGLAELADQPGPAPTLLLDTYEEIGGLDDWICRDVVPRLPTRARLVLLGRAQLTQTNVNWLEHRDILQARQLPELSEAEAKAFLRHYGLRDSTALQGVYAVTGGYPLLLVLARALADESGGWTAVGELTYDRDRSAMADRLLERILREDRLRSVRAVIETCCLAPWIEPGVVQALLRVPPAEAHVLYTELGKHSIVARHPRGLALHDKVRELLKVRLEFADPARYLELKSALDAFLARKGAL